MPDEKIKLIAGKFGHLPAAGTCAECPLRRDSEPGALGGWTVMMYLDGLYGIADFACHTSKGFMPGRREEMRSCTGVANFRCNTGIAKLLPRGNAKRAADHAGPDTIDVFKTPREFARHHTIKGVKS